MKRYYDDRTKRMKSESISASQAAGIIMFVFSVVVMLCLFTGGALFGNLGREINSFVIASLGFFFLCLFRSADLYFRGVVCGL